MSAWHIYGTSPDGGKLDTIFMFEDCCPTVSPFNGSCGCDYVFEGGPADALVFARAVLEGRETVEIQFQGSR